ncbi:putative carboxylesterase [Aspergillus stella-maris]|uniref:putative carboxylesterase n=1 Tax=Aspergillus stella-maris TaxID=1810926 RepID=UPI003CCDE4CE
MRLPLAFHCSHPLAASTLLLTLIAFTSATPLASRSTVSSTSTFNNTSRDPTITLPYITLAGKYNAEYNISYFRKIPYAAPPTGPNRFRAPQPPSIHNEDEVYDTDHSFDMCPQRTVNGSEDCLYLGLFSRPWDLERTKDAKRPVLVVFHGGAFIQGEASFDIPPSSYPVLNASDVNDYIVIYPSYRLNAFGFLPGKAIKESDDADLNPGLLDQEFVLKWVRENIEFFGGDRGNVTIWGQSAGGGSVGAQVLANGRDGKEKLFQKALASSPFWPKTYRYDDPEAEGVYERLVDLTGCNDNIHNNTNPNKKANVNRDRDAPWRKKTLSCLKQVSAQTIRDASLLISGENKWTTSSYTWAPVIDGSFLQMTLSDAVSRPGTIKTEYIMAVYNSHEGENFIPPGLAYPVSNEAGTTDGFNSSLPSFHDWLGGFVPGLSEGAIRELEDVFYPVTGGTETLETYNSTFVRAGLVYRDVVLACPAYWLASVAYAGKEGKGKGYLAEYTILPARHASDTVYWNTINPIQTTDPLTYKGFAGAFASFFQTGDPNAHKLTSDDVVGVPEISETGEEFVIGEGGFENVRLRELEERCEFWRGVGVRVPV